MCSRRPCALALTALIAGCGRIGFDRVGGAIGDVDGGAGAGDAQVAAPVAVALAAGEHHACAIRDGRLFCWGRNDTGAVGAGDMSPHLSPVPVAATATWVSVAPGGDTTCALDAEGSAWCWGDNGRGQLGQGDTAARARPTLVPNASALGELAGRYGHFMARRRSGELLAWGASGEHQTGVAGAGDRVLTPSPSWPWNDVAALAPSDGYTCALRHAGALWCFGRNTVGQLGQGSAAANQISTPVQVPSPPSVWGAVAVGQFSTFALTRDGQLWSWGDGTSGQLGDGRLAPRSSPARAGNTDGWREVTASCFHACGIQGNGSLWCWGRNDEGQLGVGTNQDVLVPTAVDGARDWAHVTAGRFFTCAAKRDGRVFCAGKNDFGQLGQGDNQSRNRLTAVPLP